jgi:hypothetical protein
LVNKEKIKQKEKPQKYKHKEILVPSPIDNYVGGNPCANSICDVIPSVFNRRDAYCCLYPYLIGHQRKAHWNCRYEILNA